MPLLPTILTSAVVAALVGPIVTHWLQARTSKQNARFDALTAAIALEGYAIESAAAVINHDLVRQSDGHAGAPIQKVPDIPELPRITVVGEFLRPRKAALASRMLSLPQHAFEAQQHVEFIWEVTGEPSEAAEIIGKESAKVALGAVNLARDLRKQFDLPSRDLRFGNLDVEESLQETINAKSQ
jgi:hypothetical protein